MLVLLSPAKNVNTDPLLFNKTLTEPVFQTEMKALMTVCKRLSVNDLSDLMKLSHKLATLNYNRFQEWSFSYVDEKCKPAMYLFNGDVYSGLDALSLKDDAIDFAQQHLYILSGLYGLLKPLDWIQPYRLEMGTPLVTSRGRHLYHFWGDLIAKEINRALLEQGDHCLINLASQEYFKAVDQKELDAYVIEPVFKDQKNGQYKVISFFAKKARGLMARYIFEHQITEPNALKNFNSNGYYYVEEVSDAHKMVFYRDENNK